ncbi:bifunctional precorrin-2 dehydrogenase/sirohydrochlorin ferrochelatase [Thermosyntropha sp.]|uniref:precorrin-2 dehydrogenase/sirohydrochlorin ferrochelatase family protein n=1 Tax=Thermosyntropha sp. TaxID=2740820 RepID=UPI0025EF9708|nr:bifunctional precorrin-2 dehydrogenase/sirohydrochlorin ferrochelatase [Thermosyntropha sp.]MBO8159510.1 bifunctional precorrin-2 dehydrogenase/sirohydrochlorin ferrochelatase [Thermosyntropha sp.]
MAHLFPVFVNLEGKNCLIVGGGKVAERKAANLFEYGAAITVVSPEVTENLKKWAEDGLIALHLRKFEIKDLNGIFMVFAATNDNNLNYEIAGLCREQGILINAVDDPPNCDFYVPSIVRRNSLAIAISTEGKSPLFAKKLRKELEEIIPSGYGWYVDLLGELRKEIKSKVADISEREEIFNKLIDDDILNWLKAGEYKKVRERVEECISYLQD